VVRLSANMGPMHRAMAFALLCVLGLTVLAACSGTPAGPPEAGGPAKVFESAQTTTVRYCNGQEARITEPTGVHGPAPAVVYVHGGSWISGDYNTGGFIINGIGPGLVSQGFVVVSINYRLGPRAHWPDQIVDVKCAIRFLRANAHRYDIDPDEIGAWGQSAGGHLVALLGTAGPSAGWDVGAYPDESSSVQAVVDMAGPSDLLTLGNKGAAVLVASSFIHLLGNVPHKQVGADLKQASPTTYVAAGDPPFLILYSNNDDIVSPRQSLELAFDLSAAGVPNQLVTVQHGGHAFDMKGEVPSQAEIVNEVVGFFERILVQHQPLPGVA
jgi:acetyl esterase/lipase